MATVVAQVRHPLAQRVRRFDAFGILPAYNVFAPRPITQDLRVRYRAWSRTDGLGEWHSLELPRARALTDVVLNPTRREKKAMFEACARVIKSYEVHGGDEDAVTISMSYLLLLGRVSAEVPDADAVQFGIWVGNGDSRQVFRSALHRLGSSPSPVRAAA